MVCTLLYEGSVKTDSMGASAKLPTFSNVLSEIKDNLYSFLRLPALAASLIWGSRYFTAWMIKIKHLSSN